MFQGEVAIGSRQIHPLIQHKTYMVGRTVPLESFLEALRRATLESLLAQLAQLTRYAAFRVASRYVKYSVTLGSVSV